MKKLVALMTAVTLILLTNAVWAEVLPIAKPEQVGLSSQRLARIGPVLKEQIEKGRFPGAVAIVARRGRIAYFDAFGQRDPATGAPMQKDAIFRLYSMTKPFVAVAAMMLAEEGKLTLADPVSKYVPQLAKLDVAVPQSGPDGKTTYTLVPAARPITIRDLLRHTSGIAYPPFTPNARVKEAYTTLGVPGIPRDVTPDDFIERLAKAPLAHQPGTVWEYGLSMDVLGHVLEVVTKTRLSELLAERVFTPLKMNDTAFVVSREKLGRLAQPFQSDKITGRPITLLDVTVPPKNDSGGGGSVGIAGDYVRFLQMLLNGGQLQGSRLLSRTTVSFMTADHLGPIKPAIPFLQPGVGFGLGFAVRGAIGAGVTPGSVGEYLWSGAAGTAFWVDPKEQLICVLLTQTPFGPELFIDWARFRELVQQAIID